MTQEIDSEALKVKISSTVERLESISKEKQRKLYSNLVKFIEIHPMKIKMGLVAPTILSRLGSSTVGSGARRGT